MPRVTDTEVKEIIDTDISDLTPYITTANLMITEHLSGSGFADDYLKEIERWLAAHFLSMGKEAGGRVVKEAVTPYSVEFVNAFGHGLRHSRYGQQVLVLDTTNTFSSFGTSRAEFQVL